MKMKLLEIRIEIKEDEYPDLSFLGEFGSRWQKYAIDRKLKGTWNRGEYEYFYPANQPEPEMTSREKHIAWDECEQDFWRMEKYSRGDWTMLLIRAVAIVKINDVIQKITSGGIGGVESDSGDDYINYMKQSELSELKSILKEIGFTTEEIEEINVEGIE